MNTQFKIRGYIAHSEQDNYQTGSMQPTLTEFGDGFSIRAKTMLELIALLSNEFMCKPKEIALNACDEMGRIDIQVMQIKPFEVGPISVAQYGKWKSGEIDLYLTDYSFQVELVQTEIDLKQYVTSEFLQTLG